jgi:hypothetical protein
MIDIVFGVGINQFDVALAFLFLNIDRHFALQPLERITVSLNAWLEPTELLYDIRRALLIEDRRIEKKQSLFQNIIEETSL